MRRIISAVMLAITLALPIVGFWQYQNIYDWWRLRDYAPPSQIAVIERNIRLTDYGRKLFYVHRPQLNGSEDFNRNCAGVEQTIVLGCYVSHRAIYLFDVQDPRLNGVEEVTSAHEILHAGYDRLTNTERQRIDRLTNQAYLENTDERIKKVVESYRKNDASVVPNELHSILATEVRQLPAELEDYYKKYFRDRLTVVAFSEKYEAVFTEQQAKIQALSDQIASLEKKLLGDKQAIDSLEAEIVRDAERLERLRSQQRYEEYNAAVPGYNAKVNEYRSLIAAYNSNVRTLNRLVEEHNSLAIEQKKLGDALDSRQQPL